jgi:peptidoglycan/LPS O-acetylase OafA/YrhL
MQAQRYEWLDIVRAGLAGLIILQHVYWLSSGQEYSWGRAQLVVNSFIILAGFFAAFSLQKKPEPYLQFVWRRYKRLLPAYIFSLGLALAVRPFVLGTNPFEAPREIHESDHFWTLLAVHVPLTHCLVPEAFLPSTGDAFLPSAWFVSLMAQLYLLAPWLVGLSEVALWRVFALSLVALIHPLTWRMYHYWSPFGGFAPQKLYLFIMGILAYYYVPLVFPPVPKPLKPALWIGRGSYWIYLVHYPLLQLLFRWL